MSSDSARVSCAALIDLQPSLNLAERLSFAQKALPYPNGRFPSLAEKVCSTAESASESEDFYTPAGYVTSSPVRSR